MKQKLWYLVTVLIIISLGTYLYLDYKWRVALNPKECWIDMYDLSLKQINELDPDKDFEKNIQKGDNRFICVWGFATMFPSLSPTRDDNIIFFNGSKMICIGDVLYEADDGEKGALLFTYAKEYNKRLLKYLKHASSNDFDANATEK